jgi:FADH2 O2-dependent halogenase
MDFDVGIIGGGPAGSSLATYLARAGVSCVVFESELFPRPHVGESLVPAANRVLSEIGFIDKMDECRFPRKLGAVWTASTTSYKRLFQTDWKGLAAVDEADIRFAERTQEGVTSDHTWHVDRGLFDNELLLHANRSGAQVYEGVRVQSVGLDEGDAREIRYCIGKRDVATRCRIVVDCSGRKTLLGNQLKLRVTDPVFDQYALHTWFSGYDRTALAKDKSFGEYIFIHFLPHANLWVWQIPITDDVTSIGVVMQRKTFPKTRESREAFFWECLKTRPELHDSLRSAKQVRPLKEEGDYSYAMKEICGDGWLLLGDAARFVDPIFSSGVSIALNSARLSWPSIVRALEAPSPVKAAFRDYEATIRRGTHNWHRFITLYYRLNVLFTSYIRDPRHRLDVLKLLQGDVYDENPPVLDEMERVITAVANDPGHVWHDHLGDLTSAAFAPSF